MSIQPALFVESLGDALREAVRACGGSKVVGAKLWPEKAPEVAGRLLQDCLNEHRPEKLSPEQVMLLARMARERNCHVVMTYLARECGYADPQPIEPESELVRSNRELTEALRLVAALTQRNEQIRTSVENVSTLQARRA
jgi:transposase